MTTFCTAPAPITASPWRRSEKQSLEEKSFSVQSPEFIPKCKQTKEEAPMRVTAAEFVPRGLGSADKAPVKGTGMTVSAAEFVPRSLRKVDPPSPSGDSATTEDSPAGKMLPNVSIMSMSTSEGSANEESSTASDSCRSRSSSPAPLAPEVVQEKEVGPIGLQSLLQWRHVAPSQRPESLLTSAAEPEPGTTEAAVAAYAAEAAVAGIPVPKEQVDPSPVSLRPGAPRKPSEDATPARPRATTLPVAEEKSWRSVAPVKKLEVSEDSWAARQRDRRRSQQGGDIMSDEDIARTMKSILNKLTVEKFDSLSVQLVHCGIRNALHLELLIHEVFEKATTQHHFIDMYADLCVLLSQQDIIDDSKKTFKKILLSCCQASFEKHLTPPAGIAALNSEDRTIAEVMYKTQMLGNIRFVGALFVRKMLASKVMLAIMEELLQDPTPEALESLAAFLSAVGPTFDTPDWVYAGALNAVFVQAEMLTKKKSVSKRVRCLLKDVLDVRKLGWQDRRPKKIEGPLKLEQIAAKAAIEGGESPKASTNADDWAVVGGVGRGKPSSPIFNKPATVCAPEKQQSGLFEKARARQEAAKSPKKEKVEEPKAARFDKDACRAEISATLAELRVSHDVADATARVASIAVPVSHQASELNKILASLTEEGSQDARKVGFELVVGLFLGNHWKPESVAKGVRRFVEDTCVELKLDVPSLPKILRDELHPALAQLVKAKMLDVEHHDSLLSV